MAVTQSDTIVPILNTQGDEITGRVYVRYVRWVGATTAGHTVSVTDSADHELFASEADGAAFIDVHPIFKWVDGVKANQMNSGKVYVYID
jgi:hypothetical protein